MERGTQVPDTESLGHPKGQEVLLHYKELGHSLSLGGGWGSCEGLSILNIEFLQPGSVGRVFACHGSPETEEGQNDF